MANSTLTVKSELSNFDDWTEIKRPALPTRIDRDRVDVIEVLGDGTLRFVEDGGGDKPPSSNPFADLV